MTRPRSLVNEDKQNQTLNNGTIRYEHHQLSTNFRFIVIMSDFVSCNNKDEDKIKQSKAMNATSWYK